MKKGVNLKEMVMEKRSFLMDTVILMIFFFAGCIGYYLGYQLDLIALTHHLIKGSLKWRHECIGVDSIGLIPPTIFLASLIALIFLEMTGVLSFTRSPLKKLDFIIEVGPMLGIVGTMISLSNAMMQVDISQGVQVAINNMTALTGQALNSSIYGIVLALVAYMMKSFCKRKWEE